LWLLSNVDFAKEGLPIIVVGIVGFVLYYFTKLFRKSE
jgi:preprotein translocase subunit Sss1